MTRLHLLKNFNNYYNRQLKIRETVNDYITDTSIFIKTINNVNFNIQDGLFTKIIINYVEDLSTPNYCLVESGYTDDDNNWVSTGFTRWFVIECKQERGLQYAISVKRDVLAEHYETIKLSECIIKKGYVDDSSILVFNQEEQQYNKKKTKELLIKDKTNQGYVVGFIASNTAGDAGNKIYTSYKGALQVDFDYSTLDASIKNLMAIGSGTPNRTTKRIYQNDPYNMTLKFNLGLTTDLDIGLGTNIVTHYDGYSYVRMSGGKGKAAYVNDTLTGYTDNGEGTYYKVLPSASAPSANVACLIVTYNANTEKPFYKNYAGLLANKFEGMNLNYFGRNFFSVSDTDMSYLAEYNGKICEISGTYYKVEIASYSVQSESASIPWTQLNLMKTILPTQSQVTVLQDNPGYILGKTPNEAQEGDFTLFAQTEQVYLRLVQQNTDIYTYLTPSANRNHLIDSPYDMFVIPYSEDLEYEYNNSSYYTNKNMAINLAQRLGEQSGTGQYDIQIVPFCPFTNIAVDGDGVPDFSLYNAQAIYSGLDDSVIGYYFWSETSSSKFQIEEERDELTLANSELTYKEITQLNKYILCSPDMASQWEFNPCMNNGISLWEISFDYRPYSSYVKVQPKWDYLYGQSSFDGMTDIRGLVYNGTNSITQLNDAWQTYLSTNKNYQNIFDTQINTQIKQYDIQNKAAWDTLIARSIGWGFVGPAMKTYYNIKEQEMQEQLQSVSLESQRKLFNYQLDNIQNQPKTVSKMTSINEDFRIFPFVEIYEGTANDITNFRNNIKWNGMTIMVVGHIENYLETGTETFIQATLLRYNEAIRIENDFTMVEEINVELNKGIYILKEE